MLRDIKHVIIINIQPKITRIYQNTIEPPVEPLEHLENLVKVQDPLKGRARHWNLTLKHHQAQVLLHDLLGHLETQYYAQHMVKIAIGAKIALITIFVMCVKLPLTLHTCAEFLSMETQQLDHLSVYTVVKLIMDQLIADTDWKTTMRSLEIQ